MSNAAVLLDDQTMQRFIRDGYITFKPDFPDGFHQRIYDRIEATIEQSGNPGNNLLPRVPELMQVFDHPQVHGALCSILGADYYLHLHRHVHDRPPGGADQNLHKDSLGNSRFAVDEKKRHHRTRWSMLFYYPQDTPLTLGPTAVMPHSQYLNVDRPEGQEEAQLAGEAGTVTIVHYDLLHRGMANHGDRNRHMVKFLFTRMSEPSSPSWAHRGADWAGSGDPQEGIWRHIWDWHCGRLSNGGADAGVAELVERLGSARELVALDAAYALGRKGREAVPALVDALAAEDEAVSRNAGYAFNGIGDEAVPGLLAATENGDPLIRARALDALGDMGLSAESAVPGLLAALEDAEEDPRRRAAEALGTVGQRADGVSGRLGAVLAEDPSGEVRRNAALSLARLGPRAADAVEVLEAGMRDENHYARGFSVHALERIGTPEAARAALRYLQTMRWD